MSTQDISNSLSSSILVQCPGLPCLFLVTPDGIADVGFVTSGNPTSEKRFVMLKSSTHHLDASLNILVFSTIHERFRIHSADFYNTQFDTLFRPRSNQTLASKLISLDSLNRVGLAVEREGKKYDYPGGKWSAGETPVLTLERELVEEGIKYQLGNGEWRLSVRHVGEGDSRHHYVTAMYIVREVIEGLEYCDPGDPRAYEYVKEIYDDMTTEADTMELTFGLKFLSETEQGRGILSRIPRKKTNEWVDFVTFSLSSPPNNSVTLGPRTSNKLGDDPNLTVDATNGKFFVVGGKQKRKKGKRNGIGVPGTARRNYNQLLIQEPNLKRLVDLFPETAENNEVEFAQQTFLTLSEL